VLPERSRCWSGPPPGAAGSAKQGAPQVGQAERMLLDAPVRDTLRGVCKRMFWRGRATSPMSGTPDAWLSLDAIHWIPVCIADGGGLSIP
jgi:hypothetical protein